MESSRKCLILSAFIISMLCSSRIVGAWTTSKPTPRVFKSHSKLSMQLSPDNLIHSINEFTNNAFMQSQLLLADEVVSVYSKVDKTGFIGFFATYIEMAIDLGNSLFETLGVNNGYGFSIILFTIFGK